jgi:probable addiction module antidote protein
MKLKNARESFHADLADPEFQREFLLAMQEEGGVDGLLEGLREIALATGQMTQIASRARVARTSMYRSLASGSNPAFKTVHAALETLGLELAIVPKQEAAGK